MLKGEGVILKRAMQIGLRGVARVARLGEQREICETEPGDERGAVAQAGESATARGARPRKRNACCDQTNSQCRQANRGSAHAAKAATFMTRMP